jgi:hypothetical protein
VIRWVGLAEDCRPVLIQDLTPAQLVFLLLLLPLAYILVDNTTPYLCASLALRYVLQGCHKHQLLELTHKTNLMHKKGEIIA